MLWVGEGDNQLWGSGRGAIAGHEGAIAGCHCSVLWQGGKVTTNLAGFAMCYGSGGVTTNFGGVDVVPLLGAIVGRKLRREEKLP